MDTGPAFPGLESPRISMRDSEAAVQSEQAPRRVRRFKNKEKANSPPPTLIYTNPTKIGVFLKSVKYKGGLESYS